MYRYLLLTLCFLILSEIVVVLFCSFEIGGVAVTASDFFFVHNVLGLLFGWINDTSVLRCNTQLIFQTRLCS